MIAKEGPGNRKKRHLFFMKSSTRVVCFIVKSGAKPTSGKRLVKAIVSTTRTGAMNFFSEVKLIEMLETGSLKHFWVQYIFDQTCQIFR